MEEPGRSRLVRGKRAISGRFSSWRITLGILRGTSIWRTSAFWSRIWQCGGERCKGQPNEDRHCLPDCCDAGVAAAGLLWPTAARRDGYPGMFVREEEPIVETRLVFRWAESASSAPFASRFLKRF